MLETPEVRENSQSLESSKKGRYSHEKLKIEPFFHKLPPTAQSALLQRVLNIHLESLQKKHLIASVVSLRFNGKTFHIRVNSPLALTEFRFCREGIITSLSGVVSASENYPIVVRIGNTRSEI